MAPLIPDSHQNERCVPHQNERCVPLRSSRPSPSSGTPRLFGGRQDEKGRPVDFWVEERLTNLLGYQPGGVWHTAHPLAILTEDARRESTDENRLAQIFL